MRPVMRRERAVSVTRHTHATFVAIRGRSEHVDGIVNELFAVARITDESTLAIIGAVIPI